MFYLVRADILLNLLKKGDFLKIPTNMKHQLDNNSVNDLGLICFGVENEK